jgi:cellulose synthase/poly-beta-1,6-N-acetylglucosamine synthase-like glycosyltransferase
VNSISVYLFWVSVSMVLYAYFLYPALLFLCYAVAQLHSDLRYLLMRGDRRTPSLGAEGLPSVSFLIPVYNEERHLTNKLGNLRQVNYPRDKLQVLFVSDGSTDRTNEILQSVTDANIETYMLPTRTGKATALNHAATRARHDILVFSDGSTLFAPDSVQRLVRHFVDGSVGAVCGALRFQGSLESRQTEGVYWRYESMLRLMEARLGATLTASGAIYAVRREAYVPLAADTVLDDFVVPMNVRKIGYQVLYDPEAMATDVAASTVAGEFTRRVRLAVGSFRAFRDLARVPLDRATRLAFYSHKVLRWIVPWFLIVLLASSASLSVYPFYKTFFLLQLAFYLWAVLGFLLREQVRRFRFGLLGYFLCAMNLAFLVGFVRFLLSRKDVIWQRIE